MPKVSVIVPLYNVEDYLKRSLDSLVNQTLKDIEIILVDDCSTDKSLKIAKEYSKNDKRIKVINSKENQGAAAARNKGLDIAKGEYIGFIDADDYIDLNYYEELYKKAKEKDADIAKCKRVNFLQGGVKKISSINKSIKNKSKFYFSSEWTTAIYRAALISKNNIRLVPEFKVAEDVIFLNQIVLKADKIEVIDSVNYYYCRREDSLNQNFYSKAKLLNNLKAIEYVINIYNKAFREKEITKSIYLRQYIKYLDVIGIFVMSRTKDFELKRRCIKKYIQLFNKCELKKDLEKKFEDKELLNHIKNENIDLIVEDYLKKVTKVSVIIPIYNVEPYLKRCLNSLVNQTLRDIEIILIDDCSTDKSLKIAEKYAKEDCRIKVIKLSKNSGAAVARNKGLEVAKGEYLGFVDSDDDIDLNYYEVLYDKTSRKKLDIVKCQRIKIAEDGTRKPGHLNNDIRKTKSIYSFTYEWQTAIYRSSMIFDNHINFPPDVRKAQDAVFLYRVILKAKTYAITDKVYYYYYKRSDSLDAKKIPIESIKSSLIASTYIIKIINEAFDEGDLTDDDYIKVFYRRLTVISSFTMYQNDSYEAKILCIKKYLELFHQCKLPEKLKKSFPPIFKYFLIAVENNDVEELTDYFINYRNIQKYNIHKLKSSIQKDLLCQKSQ